MTSYSLCQSFVGTLQVAKRNRNVPEEELVKGGDHPVTSTDFEVGNTDCVEMLVNTMLYI